MSLENLAYDAMGHFGAGVVISLLDYTTTRLHKSFDERVMEKRRCLESMEYILDMNKPVTINAGESQTVPRVAVNPLDYAMKVEDVKQYLRREGFAKFRIPFGQRVNEFGERLLSEEKINNLSLSGKVYFTIGAELFDNVVSYAYYLYVAKENLWTAFFRNGYQMPMFFAGLLTGSATRSMIDFFVTSRDERKLDKALRTLVQTSPIVSIAISYEPTPELKRQMESEGVSYYKYKLTRTGKGVYSKLQRMGVQLMQGTKAITESVTQMGERKRQADAAASEARKRRFDDLTKGR